jgi:hypothetical protein
MVFQSFQQTWKPLQPKLVEPVLQPKHFLVAPAVPTVAPVDKPVVPVQKPVAPVATVAATPFVAPVVHEAQEATECACAPRPWFASPWVSLGLAVGFVVMLLWAVSTRLENAWLMKQHTQLMFNLLETLRL